MGGQSMLVDTEKEDDLHVIRQNYREMGTITAARSCEAEAHDTRTKKMFLFR